MSESDKRVIFICLFNSLASIMPVGYQIVALNVPEKILQDAVNSSWQRLFGDSLPLPAMAVFWSATVACQSLGALMGCASLVFLAPRYGAKTLLMRGSNYVLLAASVFFATTYWLDFALFLPMGRFMAGVHTGMSCSILPLFIHEIAPKELKGALGCFIHMAVCLGSSLSAVLSLPFILGGDRTWWIFLTLPAAFGIAQLTVSKFLPDTPNHLIQSGSFVEAVKAIKFYYNIETDDNNAAIESYWERVSQMPPQLPARQVLADPVLRWQVLLGMVVSATQVFSGSMVTISYSTSMFESVSFLGDLIPYLPSFGSLISTLLTLPSLRLVESCGRRPLLLYTIALCLISNILFLYFSILSTNPDDHWASWLFGLTFLLYGVGYNLGAGPVAYFIPAELVPPEAASFSLGAAVATNWLSTLTTTFLFYPSRVYMGGWSYLLFIIPTSFFLAFLWNYLPETKKTLPETKNYLPETKKFLPETKNYPPETKKTLPKTKNYLPETKKTLPETKNYLPETKKTPSESMDNSTVKVPKILLVYGTFDEQENVKE